MAEPGTDDLRAQWKEIAELARAQGRPDLVTEAEAELASLPPEQSHELPLTPDQKARIARGQAAGQNPMPKTGFGAFRDEVGKGDKAFATAAADTLTMGASGDVADYLDLSTPGARMQMREAMPVESAVGGATGLVGSALAPLGPARLAGKGGQTVAKGAAEALEALAERFVPALAGRSLPARGVQALGKAGQLGVEGAVGAGLYGVADETARGGSDEEIAARLYDDGTMGGAIGGGLGLGGQVAGGMSSLVRAASPWIKRFREAEAAGVYADPDSVMMSLKPGAEGIRESADTGLTNILKRRQGLRDEASDAYQTAVGPPNPPGPPPMPQSPIETITPSMLRERLALGPNNQPPLPPRPPPTGQARPVDWEALVGELEAQQAANIGEAGGPRNKSLHAKYQELINETPGGPKWDRGYLTEMPGPTAGGTLLRRRDLAEAGNFRSPDPSTAEREAQKIYQTFRRAVRKASPDVIAPADDAFAASATKHERGGDILFNTEDEVVKGGRDLADTPDFELADDLAPERHGIEADAPRLRVGKEKAATDVLMRVGDRNVPGLRVKKYLDEFAQQDPEFAKWLEFIANKKAHAGTRVGWETPLPDSLGGVSKIAGFGHLGAQNLRALGARVVDPAAESVHQLLSPGRLAGPALPPWLPQIEEDARQAHRRIEAHQRRVAANKQK